MFLTFYKNNNVKSQTVIYEILQCASEGRNKHISTSFGLDDCLFFNDNPFVFLIVLIFVNRIIRPIRTYAKCKRWVLRTPDNSIHVVPITFYGHNGWQSLAKCHRSNFLFFHVSPTCQYSCSQHGICLNILCSFYHL